MKNLLRQLKIRSHNILYAAFVPLADYTGSKKLSTLFADQSLVTYLNTLFKMAITVGAIIAVLRLLYAGYIYMVSDVFVSKEKAKEIFRDVFLGLFLLLSIYIILSQINPNLLNLMPKIDKFVPPPAAQGLVAPVPGTGCSGCVPIPNGVPAKAPGTGCKLPGPCMVSKTMASKLLRVVTNHPSLDAWRVTEAYPPTVAHSGPNSCHNNGLGTCVDANFIGIVTPQGIIAFINAANNVGLDARWEVASQARQQALSASGVPASAILVTGNAEHFHITGG